MLVDPKKQEPNSYALNFFSISEMECVRSLEYVAELQLLRNIELYR